MRIFALGGVFQGDFHGVAQVVAAVDLTATACTPCAATAEHVAKNIAKGFSKAATAAKTATHAAVGVYAGVTVLVISSALLAVREHFVGLFGLFELLFGFLGLLALIAVRVVLHGQLAVGLFQFFVRGGLADAEDFVKVAFGHWYLQTVKNRNAAQVALAGGSAAASGHVCRCVQITSSLP